MSAATTGSGADLIPQTYRGQPLVFAWAYRAPDGTLLGVVGRYEAAGAGKKEVIPFFKASGSGFAAGSASGLRPLFGLESIQAGSDYVFIVEGERCAAALQSLGLPAVTSQGGSKAAHKADWSPLSGFKKVFLLPDHDEPGQDYARTVCRCLAALQVPPAVTEVALPDLSPAGDVVDWIQSCCSGWNGFEPLPITEREMLLSNLREMVKAHGRVPPEEPCRPVPDEGWELPISLDNEPLPQWPMGSFPAPVEAFVLGLSEATETPVELAAMMTLGVLAAAAAGKFRISVKPGGYSEPLNLFVASAMPPGSRKTSVQNEVTKPVRACEQQQRRTLESAIHQKTSEHKTLSVRIENLRKKAARVPNGDLQALMTEIARTEAELPQIPTPPRMITDDCTPERLAALMAEHGECMAIISDEGGLFDGMGRYSRGLPNLDIYLQGHAGTPVQVDRGSRPPVNLNAPCLTIAITPQPSVLQSLGVNPVYRNRGLIARFLMVLPQSNLGQRSGNTQPLSEDLKLRWEGVVHALLNANRAVTPAGDAVAHELKLSAHAYSLWQDFWQEVEHEMRAEEGQLHSIQDWAGKLPGAVARIAGLLHVTRYAFRQPTAFEVDAVDMAAAVAMGRCLRAHALAVFDLMRAVPEFEEARRILNWIRSNQFDVVSFRDVHHRFKARLKKASDLEPVMALLVERHFIRPQGGMIRTGPGRRQRMYEVNPCIHKSNQAGD